MKILANILRGIKTAFDREPVWVLIFASWVLFLFVWGVTH